MIKSVVIVVNYDNSDKAAVKRTTDLIGRILAHDTPDTRIFFPTVPVIDEWDTRTSSRPATRQAA